METTHVNGTAHPRDLNGAATQGAGKSHTHTHLRAVWQAIATKKTTVVTVVSAVLVAGAAYAARAALGKK